MDALERVVFTRGRYRLVERRALADDGAVEPFQYRIVDDSAPAIEPVDSIESGFLRIDELLAMDRATHAMEGPPAPAGSGRLSMRR